jgi:hypothetical protein
VRASRLLAVPPHAHPSTNASGCSAAASEWVAAFVQRLRELSWIEGRTIAIEYRWSEGRDERAAEIVTEFLAAQR